MAKRERGVFLVWTKVFQEVLKTTFQLKIHFPVDKNAFSSYCEIVQTNFMILLSVTIVTCEDIKKTSQKLRNCPNSRYSKYRTSLGLPFEGI